MPHPEVEPTELPEPSAQLVIARVCLEAHFELLGPKKGRRFLQSVVTKLSDEEQLASVAFIRPSKDAAAVARARRQALAWVKACAPIFVAKL